MTGSQLLTTGQIAAETHYDRSTVHRKLEELGIEPELTAGRTRLFAAAVIDAIGINPDRKS